MTTGHLPALTLLLLAAAPLSAQEAPASPPDTPLGNVIATVNGESLRFE